MTKKLKTRSITMTVVTFTGTTGNPFSNNLPVNTVPEKIKLPIVKQSMKGTSMPENYYEEPTAKKKFIKENKKQKNKK